MPQQKKWEDKVREEFMKEYENNATVNMERVADWFISKFSTLLDQRQKELVEAIRIDSFIAEIKTDDDEKLWVRIDNYLPEKQGSILLISQEKLDSLLTPKE